MTVHPDRLHILNGGSAGTGPVIYWMSRDQRIDDNWAMLYAQKQALERRVPLVIVFCLVPNFPGATHRPYDFMLNGLLETSNRAKTLNIAFYILHGNPTHELPNAVKQLDAGELVTDFDPLNIKRNWRETVAGALSIRMTEVDAHNIVPCRIASPKKEYAAATFRPKINRRIAEFLVPFPKLKPHPHRLPNPPDPPDIIQAFRMISADEVVGPAPNIIPGPRAGMNMLDSFITHRLQRYNLSNDPNAGAVSGLSPYLHFGQISAQRVALEIIGSPRADTDNAAAFLEELIVRRELSDNFCWYEPAYDSLSAANDWARQTLDDHRGDPRDFVYDHDTFERAETHDPLWNAAQREMMLTGTMHGYLRMYWAKKILEWSPSPEEALATAIHLNDRYELDGRDPNGCTGCLWSIGGVHDRAWREREVFGKIRYMNDRGCRRKFDVNAYIGKINRLSLDNRGPQMSSDA